MYYLIEAVSFLQGGYVSVFEIVIRFLGGLLSMYAFTRDEVISYFYHRSFKLTETVEINLLLEPI